MIVGVTGLLGSGKDSFANYLIERSFYHISLSDMLREELKKRKIPINRKNLQKIGNELRTEFGDSVLAVKAMESMQKDKNYVVTSIRTVAEIEELRKKQDFFLVFIERELEKRFELIQKRESRPDDPKSIEELNEMEAKEMDTEKHGQQLNLMKKNANVVINNNSTLDKFYEKTDKMLQDSMIKYKIPRPNWDDYYMNIAKAVALRSNCMKRHVAAVIVKEHRIISTGYNGTPRGVKNCDEGGCKRCNSFAKAGTNLGDCRCSHGEENAIVQAAYHGISIKGSVIYSTFVPCMWCSKMIINAGIVKVVYNVDYALTEDASAMLKEAGVIMEQRKVD